MTGQQESTYVRIATSLRRPEIDLGMAKNLCLELARQVDALLSTLADATRLAEAQYDQLSRLRADSARLREQLDDLQRLAEQRGNAVAGLLQQQSPIA